MAAPATVDEPRTLIEAALTVLRRRGADKCTVAEVLAEAGLSTRAFYRHFASKDELVLAIYERDSQATRARLRSRIDDAPTPRAALDVWIDEMLALGFDARRASRTRPLAREGARLQGEYPVEFAAMAAAVFDPLAEVLRALGDENAVRDAPSIHAVAWSLVNERLAGGSITRDEARAQVLRFALPVVGLTQ